ncbi:MULTISPECIES: hypothetical protein [Pseudomonas]|uniref:Uncharacterized protein n=2 Tax=Pseudomonas luteola TaxID=47886 RepID=A0ABS0MY22_PSELU|nr:MULTISPECIES: hypothetical protein [Pseudomonas]MBA1250177.1 hypothetical protein [Pseudomonas zeshuii]MBH3440928.1 hypothetical protein [Pseudomonas luteola]
MRPLPISVSTALDAVTAGKLISGGWLAHKELLEVGMSVLKQHNYTCRACGFKSRPSKEVPHGWMIPVDLNSPSLVALSSEAGLCLCPFCTSTLTINWSVVPTVRSGKEAPSPGMLILLPHLSQHEINRIALHTLSILSSTSIMESSPIRDMAVKVDSVMSSLQKELTLYIEPYRSEHDADFARALALIPVDLYEKRNEVLSPVRWWPTMSYWQEQGLYWTYSTFNKF